MSVITCQLPAIRLSLFVTGLMDPPQVTVAATTHTSINVKWEPINVPVNTWTVTVVKNGTDKPIKVCLVIPKYISTMDSFLQNYTELMAEHCKLQ